MDDNREIDRSLIGSVAASFSVEVEKGAIRNYAEAIGDTAAIYVNEEAARSAGYPGIVAPPTFPTTFRPKSKPAWVSNLDEGRILAGEQAFWYRRPIFAGDVLQLALRFTGVQDKTGSKGKMELLVQDLMVSTGHGEVICINRRVIVYRGRVPLDAPQGADR